MVPAAVGGKEIQENKKEVLVVSYWPLRFNVSRHHKRIMIRHKCLQSVFVVQAGNLLG